MRARWLWMVVAVTLLASGCGDDDPTGPTVYCQTPNGEVTFVVRCPDVKVVKQ